MITNYIAVDMVEMVSLHFKDGQSKSFKKKDIKKIPKSILLGTSFLFAAINVYGTRSPYIVRDIQEVVEVLCIL